MKITDGSGTTLTWATSSSFVVSKTEIKPYGLDGGGRVETTTLENTIWETASPKKLKKCTALTFEGLFDPALLAAAPVNVNDTITITYPDGSHDVVRGWLDKWEPGTIKVGDKTTCSGTIEISNQNGGTETGPAFTPAS